MPKFIFVFLILICQTAFAQSDTVISLRAITGLQYDLVRFAVRPNQRVTVILKNEDDMAHNIVFTKPNKRLEVADAAIKMGHKGQAANYVPTSPEMRAVILAASKILMPNTTENIVFVAPEQQGIYPYVCTYPGHGYVMYGAMYVTNAAMPPLETDQHIPPQSASAASAHHHHVAAPSPHPFALEYPLVYRTFMPDCGPAAIAVAFSENHAYCFDAGKCCFRYAWTGGFIDNTDHWKGNGNALAKPAGKPYVVETVFPFLFPNQPLSKVQFLGYTLAKRLPTFRYRMGEVEISETLRSMPNDAGIARSFVFKKPLLQTLLFFKNSTDVSTKIQPNFKTKGGQYYLIPKGTKRFLVQTKKA